MRFGLSSAAAFAAALSVVVFAPSARAALLFDSYTSDSGYSVRAAGSSPVLFANVTTAFTLTQIAVRNDLDTAGDIKFLVYNATTNQILYSSAGKAFADDGYSYKLSDPLSLAVPVGSYYIGGIANVSGRWSYDGASSTSNGITGVPANGNVTNYDTPVLDAPGMARIAVQIYGTPEPAGLAGVGLVAAAALRRRSKCRGS